MSEFEKPEGSLSEADGVYVGDDGELIAEMETLQKNGNDSESAE